MKNKSNRLFDGFKEIRKLYRNEIRKEKISKPKTVEGCKFVCNLPRNIKDIDLKSMYGKIFVASSSHPLYVVIENANSKFICRRAKLKDLKP